MRYVYFRLRSHQKKISFFQIYSRIDKVNYNDVYVQNLFIKFPRFHTI